MAPTPTGDHQVLSTDLVTVLNQYVRANRLGLLLAAPMDVVIRRTPKLQTRQPDILYFHGDRTGFRSRADVQGIAAFEVAPDLVVEFLSPDERRKTLEGKLKDYAEIGVTEVWLVSSEAETVEVLGLSDGQYHRSGLYGRGDILVSSVLPGLNLSVDTIFEG